MVFTKKEFAKRYADITDYTIGESTEIVDSVFDLLKKMLIEGSTINLHGFLTIGARRKHGYESHDISCGEMRYVDARWSPYCHFSRLFKKDLAESHAKKQKREDYNGSK